VRGAARPAVLLLSTALTLPVVLGALASPAEAVTSTPAEATATATPAEVVTERVVSDPAISESSGLAPSLLHRGVLWTHNDSGHDPVLYALARDGSTTARFTVTGVRGRDWEAVQTLRDRHGRALVAVADTGNNEGNHETVDVVLVREPTVLRARTGGSLRPLTTVRLRYPDGPADCEALLADPRDGRLYLVTKGVLGGTLYAVPEAAWPGSGTGGSERPRVVRASLIPVTRISVPLVTDGAMLPDGQLVLRSYQRLAVLPPPEGLRGVPVAPVTAWASLPAQRQGESLALIDGAVLVGSEGVGSPVLRVRLPSGVTVATTTSGRAGAGQGHDRGAGGPGGTGWLPVRGRGAVAGLAVIVAVATVVATLRLRRRSVGRSGSRSGG